MSIITAILLGCLAFASAVIFRTRGDRYWAAIGAISVASGALLWIRNGLYVSAAVDVGDLLLLVIGLIAAAEAFGLPRSLAARLGIGLRSRDWEFDRKLSDLLRPLEPVLDGREPETRDEAFGNRRSAVVDDGRARLTALARLKPPDDRWRALTSTYATILRARLDAIQGDPPGAAPPSIVQMTKAAEIERERLRASYRAEADRLIRSSLVGRLLRRPRD